MSSGFTKQDLIDLANPSKHLHVNTQRQRLELCQSCPDRQQIEGTKPITKKSRCPFCGCFCQAKAKLKTHNCPMGDW